MRSRRASILTAALLLPLVLTACGEKTRSEASDLAKPKSLPSVHPTVFPAPAATSAAPGAPGATTEPGATTPPPAAGSGDEVQATVDNKFLPATLSVKVGTKVTWTNPAKGFHSVTGGENGTKDPASPLNQATGQWTTYSVTFTKAGAYKYYCEPHLSLGMTGEITVT